MPATVADFIFLLLNVFSILIIARALVSWFDPGMRSSVGRFLHDATEPIIAPIRQVVPSLGMIDISPIVALILIRVLEQLLRQAIYG